MKKRWDKKNETEWNKMKYKGLIIIIEIVIMINY